MKCARRFHLAGKYDLLGAVSDTVLLEKKTMWMDDEFGLKLTLKWLRLHLDCCAFLPVDPSLGTTELC